MASTLYPPFLTHKPHHFFLTLPIKPRSTITCQDSSKPSTTSTNDPTINPIITTTDQPNKPPPQPVVSSSGQGFGPAQPNKKKKGEKKREGSKVIRRAPVRKTELLGVEGGEVAKERSKGEEAFVLAWLGFGGLVLVEGVALAASDKACCCSQKIIELNSFLCTGTFGNLGNECRTHVGIPTRRVGQVLCQVSIPNFHPNSFPVCCWNGCLWCAQVPGE